ncbi:glycosyltransferase [Halomonas sp. DP8Y7-1]|uniref:glycosyltransferase n=1 Tax=Halomonas sp. DP8Y7-1 TaxID=2859078 RepID=UPI001C98E197|nr:glycosyltransferase [Halomonas sp. DP8Y7-1]MBY6030311.1 glycosyltransferase [Halomonas sp. DP8Y7-1]
MRTLVVVRSLKMGGMERVAVNLADAFHEAGHESHLVSFRKVKRPLAPEHEGVTVHHLPLQQRNRLTLIGYGLEVIARLILNPLLGRALFLGNGIMGGVVFRHWLKRFEKQYGKVDRIVFRGIGTFELVWSFSDKRARYVLENIFHLKGTSRRRMLFARCLYHRRDLVAVSEGVADSLREAQALWKFRPRSLTVIPNPCPIRAIRRSMHEDNPQIPEQPYLLNVARLVPAKGHDLLLRAYALSETQMPLVLVGDGQEREALERLAEELGIAERVFFAGNQQNPYPWMHQARLFVLSSRFEGMGIVLFEALACGTPVLSVDCPGGVRQILKGELETCLVERDASSLAEGINQALASPKPAIRDAWLQDFMPERVAAAFIDS